LCKPGCPALLDTAASSVHPLPIGNFMKNSLAVATFVSMAISIVTPAWCADNASDAAQVKRQSVVIPKLKQAAAKAAGYESKSIEVKTTAHQVTIAVINSKLNGGVAADREAQASTIASAIEKEIAGKAEFGQVVVIHVDYVKRPGKSATAIQGFDFFKSPTGSFVLHRT
jgi:hypothetical protein